MENVDETDEKAWTCDQFAIYTIAGEKPADFISRLGDVVAKRGDVDVFNIVITWFWTRDNATHELVHQGRASVYFTHNNETDTG
jgi:hypothetical protein